MIYRVIVGNDDSNNIRGIQNVVEETLKHESYFILASNDLVTRLHTRTGYKRVPKKGTFQDLEDFIAKQRDYLKNKPGEEQAVNLYIPEKDYQIEPFTYEYLSGLLGKGYEFVDASGKGLRKRPKRRLAVGRKEPSKDKGPDDPLEKMNIALAAEIKDFLKRKYRQN